MIARTAKNIFLETISYKILCSGVGSDPLNINHFIVDFLNLLLGKSDETLHFFKDIVYPRVVDYFGVTFEDLEMIELHPVALYHFFIDLAMIKKSINQSKMVTP